MQKTKRLSLRVLAAMFAVAILLCAMPAPVQAAQTREELDEIIRQLEAQRDAINQDIAAAQNDVNAAASVKNYYQQQADNLQASINAQKEKIALSEGQITSAQSAIESTQLSLDLTRSEIELTTLEVEGLQQSVNESQALFEDRLVAIYKMNNSGILSTLLNVTSFSELLTVSNSLQRITKHDTELIETLQQQRRELEAEQQRLEEYARQLEADQQEYQRQKEELEGLVSQLNNEYTELNGQKGELANSLAAANDNLSQAEADKQAQVDALGRTQEEIDYYNKLIDEMAAAGSNAAAGGSSTDDGSTQVTDDEGALTWPVPGYGGVTCEFGQPDYAGRGHLGMDISSSGIAGASVVAAGSGTVITATYHPSYGNYIMVDHGGGLKTLYAHLASIGVGVGAEVARGSGIGTVGNTGEVVSFGGGGYHLHFEVYVNNSRVNPRSYLG